MNELHRISQLTTSQSALALETLKSRFSRNNEPEPKSGACDATCRALCAMRTLPVCEGPFFTAARPRLLRRRCPRTVPRPAGGAERCCTRVGAAAGGNGVPPREMSQNGAVPAGLDSGEDAFEVKDKSGGSLDSRILSGEFTDEGSTKEKLTRPLRKALAKDPLGPGAPHV